MTLLPLLAINSHHIVTVRCSLVAVEHGNNVCINNNIDDIHTYMYIWRGMWVTHKVTGLWFGHTYTRQYNYCDIHPSMEYKPQLRSVCF